MNELTKIEKEKKVLGTIFDSPGDMEKISQSLAKPPTSTILSPQENSVLYAPIDFDEVSVRGFDGIPFVPFSKCYTRLVNAVGSDFELREKGEIKIEETKQTKTGKDGQEKEITVWTVFVCGELFIRGERKAFAYGEGKWTSDNNKMSRTDAIEIAFSKVLKRCCKKIGMFPEIYDKDWRDSFCNAFVRELGKGFVKIEPQKQHTPEPKKAEVKTETGEKPNFANFWVTCKKHSISESWVHFLAGVESIKDFSIAQMDTLWGRLVFMEKLGSIFDQIGKEEFVNFLAERGYASVSEVVMIERRDQLIKDFQTSFTLIL